MTQFIFFIYVLMIFLSLFFVEAEKRMTLFTTFLIFLVFSFTQYLQTFSDIFSYFTMQLIFVALLSMIVQR